MHQCVVSFHSHFQYGLLPLLTPRSSDPRSKHQRYSICKQQHCYCPCLVDPSSSRCHYPLGEKKVSQQFYIFFLNITFVGISCGLEYLHQTIFKSPLTIFLLKIGESMNITSKAVPLGNILSDKWVNGNINFFFYVLQQLFMFLVPTMQEN